MPDDPTFSDYVQSGQAETDAQAWYDDMDMADIKEAWVILGDANADYYRWKAQQ